MADITFEQYFNALPPEASPVAESALLTLFNGEAKTVTLASVAELIVPEAVEGLSIFSVGTDAAYQEAVALDPNRIIVQTELGVATKVWLSGATLTPGTNYAPPEEPVIVNPPDIVMVPAILPATGGGVGTRYTIRKGTYYSLGHAITVTGGLTLNGVDVTDQIIDGVYIGEVPGTLTWTEVASNSGGVHGPNVGTASISSEVYPKSAPITIDGVPWTFTKKAGVMEDGKTIALFGSSAGAAGARADIPVTIGKEYTVEYAVDNNNVSRYGWGTGWVTNNVGGYSFKHTATKAIEDFRLAGSAVAGSFMRNFQIEGLSVPGMAPEMRVAPNISPFISGVGDQLTITPGRYRGELPITVVGTLMLGTSDVTGQVTEGPNGTKLFTASALTESLQYTEIATNAVGTIAAPARSNKARIVPDPSNVLPVGYVQMASLNFDRSLLYGWSDQNMNVYFPNWHNGVLSTSVPAMVEFTETTNKVILHAEMRPDNEWYMGSLQLKRPLRVLGRCGTVVTILNGGAVTAFFCYNKNGLEIDFENTLRDGVAGWTPAVHMPREGGGTAHSNKRALNRAPAPVGVPTILEYDRQAEKVDFYCNGELFETVTRADMSAGYIWDTTTAADLFWSIERHASWAGWSYPVGLTVDMEIHGVLL